MITENKFKGTPGPWKVDDYGHYIWSSDMMMVAELRGWGHLTGAPMKLSEDDAAKVQDANARLIAAAPDLLEALQRIVEYDGYETEYDGSMYTICPSCHTQSLEHLDGCDFIRARAAIAKALGE